jgi:hypothetical protein
MSHIWAWNVFTFRQELSQAHSLGQSIKLSVEVYFVLDILTDIK